MLFELIRNVDTQQERVVEELNDKLWDLGWRHVKHLKNSEVNYVSYLADLQEEQDKENDPICDLPKEREKEIKDLLKSEYKSIFNNN